MFRRLFKALRAIFWGQLLGRAGSLLLVPLYLSCWSAPVYGEWLAMSALVSQLGIADSGMQYAAINRLTQSYAKGNLEEYRLYQHSALAFYVAIAAAGSVLICVLASAAPVTLWLGLKHTPQTQAAWVVMILGAQVLWSMPARLLAGVYQTTGDLARTQWIFNVQQVMFICLSVVFLLLGRGVVAIALLQIALTVAIIIFVLWDVRGRFAELYPGVTFANLTSVKALLKPSMSFGVMTLANAISHQGSIIIISASFGGVVVAIYSIYRTLAGLIRAVGDALYHVVWPDVTKLEALAEHEKLRTLHRLLVTTSTGLCIAFSSSLWHVGAETVTLWTGGRLDPEPTLLRLMLVGLVLQAPWIASSVFTAASNRPKNLARSYLVAAVTGVGVAAVLINWLGTWAVPVGLTVGEALACYHFVIRDTCGLVGEPYGPFARRLWAGIVIGMVGSVVCGGLVSGGISGPLLVRWAAVGAATFASSALVAWMVWLTPEARSLMMLRLRPLFATVYGKA